MAIDKVTIRSIEECSANAWPSLQTVNYDGWILRFAETYTRRANSVSPFGAGVRALDDKIAYCEALYASRGQETVFKVTEASEPAQLDDRLAERGYVGLPHTSVQLCDLGSVPETSETISITPQATTDWIRASVLYSGDETLDPHKIAIRERILGNVVLPTAFGTVYNGERIASVGMAVLDRGFVGLFSIATAPDLRKQGYGTRVVRGLLNWGKRSGALQAYLQVLPNNVNAIRLYASIGFNEAYRYWYRVKALPTQSG